MMSESPAPIVESDYFTAHVPEHKLERILAAVQTPRHSALLTEVHGNARFAAWLLLADIWLRRVTAAIMRRMMAIAGGAR